MPLPASSNIQPTGRNTFVVLASNTKTTTMTPDHTQTTLLSDAEPVSDHAVRTSGWPIWPRCLPAHFQDMLLEPSLPSPIDPEAQSADLESRSSNLPHVILHVFDSLHTSFNKFGVAHEYHHQLSYDPDAFITIDQLSNTSNLSSACPNIPSLPPPPPWPWKNMGIWCLMTWMMTDSRQKSEAEVTHLVHEVINLDGFNHHHFNGFNTHTQMKHFDRSENDVDQHDANLQDGWKESSVNISVPTWE